MEGVKNSKNFADVLNGNPSLTFSSLSVTSFLGQSIRSSEREGPFCNFMKQWRGIMFGFAPPFKGGGRTITSSSGLEAMCRYPNNEVKLDHPRNQKTPMTWELGSEIYLFGSRY